MASTTKTTNLELSQFVGTDKPTWLTDYNGDMQKIDNGYKKLEDANTATQTDLNNTKQDLAGSKTDIDDVKASVQALEAQDIALGNRLTVVEGNYDTMHHEVVINKQSIEKINKNFIWKRKEVNATSAVAGSNYSSINGEFNNKDAETLFILYIDAYDVTVTGDTVLFDLSSLFVNKSYIPTDSIEVAALSSDSTNIELIAINIDNNFKVKATVAKGTGHVSRIRAKLMFLATPV